jgi:hypothetical protein
MPLSVHKSGPFWSRKYTLLEDWSYEIVWRGACYLRTLPKGWVFDGATFGWLINLRKEASMEPAARHDDGYENRGKIKADRLFGGPETDLDIPKEQWDARYLKDIGDDGVNAKSWQVALIKAAFATVGKLMWRT